MRITSAVLVRWPVLLCHCKKSPNKHSLLAPGTATAWPLGLQERTFLSSTSCTLADQAEPSRFTARCAPGADITVPKTQFMFWTCLDSEEGSRARRGSELSPQQPSWAPWMLCLRTLGSPRIEASMCKEVSPTHLASTQLIHPHLAWAAQGIPYTRFAVCSIMCDCNSQTTVFRPSPLYLTLQQKPFIDLQKMVWMGLNGVLYFQT